MSKRRSSAASSAVRGKLGVVLVAGGQGTRLGFDHPKGLFPVGPISKAPLFQILFEKLLAAGTRYGAAIPLYIMTSPATHDDTVAASRSTPVSVCRPRTSWPSARERCRPSTPSRASCSWKAGSLFLSPDGHGGMLGALDRSGALADIQRPGSSSCSTCRSTIPWSWSAIRCSSATTCWQNPRRRRKSSPSSSRSIGSATWWPSTAGADHRVQRSARRCGGPAAAGRFAQALGG